MTCEWIDEPAPTAQRLEKLNEACGMRFFHPETSRMRRCLLPFAADCHLVEARAINMRPPVTLRFFEREETCLHLDGHPAPFEAVAPLRFSAESAEDYIRLYIQNVLWRGKACRVIESVSDLIFSENISAPQKKKLEARIHPPEIRLDKKEEISARLTILAEHALMETEMIFSPDGTRQLTGRQTIARQLPLLEEGTLR